MSGTISTSAQLELYLQREETMLGRMTNRVVDIARQSIGMPGIWLQAAEYDMQKLNARQTIADHGEMAVSSSGLNMADQRAAMSMISAYEREYPGISQENLDMMIERTIDFMRERAEDRLLQNQLNLFAQNLIDQTKTPDREAGLQKLEDLALRLREAEERMTDNLLEPDDLGPWDQVDDQMLLVCRDPDALHIASEWGFQPTPYGPPLLNERGTELQSADLFAKLAQEKSHDLGHSR